MAGRAMTALRRRGYWLLAFIIVLWVIEILNSLSGHRLDGLGIRPRTASGLVGIFTSPFIHGGFQHLLLNTAPLAVLGGLVLVRGTRVFAAVCVFVITVGGAAVWLFARSASHIGASGLVFGLFAFLVARGYYERTARSIIVAAVTLFVYGGMIWGVLPRGPQISWEAHLFGLIAGAVAARLWTQRSGR